MVFSVITLLTCSLPKSDNNGQKVRQVAGDLCSRFGRSFTKCLAEMELPTTVFGTSALPGVTLPLEKKCIKGLCDK